MPRRRHRRIPGAVALLLALVVGGAPAADDPLPAQLAGGGFNIFWRHAHAGVGMDIIRHTTDPAELADCARQRDLDDRGREDARLFGDALRARRIPVGEVLASPYCRTLRSAHLAFGEDAVRREPGIGTVCEVPPEVFEQNTARLRELLASPAPPGGNRVLVSHNCNVRALAKLLAEKCAREPEQGDAVVFRPVAEAPGFEFVACLDLARLRRWAKGE